MWLFDRLVWTVVGYGDMGMERERERVKRLQEIYKMGHGGRRKDARVYGERKVSKGEDKE